MNGRRLRCEFFLIFNKSHSDFSATSSAILKIFRLPSSLSFWLNLPTVATNSRPRLESSTSAAVQSSSGLTWYPPNNSAYFPVERFAKVCQTKTRPLDDQTTLGSIGDLLRLFSTA